MICAVIAAQISIKNLIESSKETKMQQAQSLVLRKLDLLTLFVIFLILNYIDAAFTVSLILRDGYAVEGNPIIHWLLVQTDTTLILWLWKFIILGLVAITTRMCSGTKYENRWKRVMIASNALLFLVVLWGGYCL